jgi:hypothetical protein
MPDEPNGANGSGTQNNSDANRDNPSPNDDVITLRLRDLVDEEGEIVVERLPELLQRPVKALRQEAGKWRTQYRQEQEETRKREQARLAEEGRYKELAETQAREIADLAAHKERAESLDKLFREMNQKRIEQIPETMRKAVPMKYAPEELANWLNDNWAMLTQKPAPDLDAGAGGSGGNTPVRLDEEERQIAAKFGMTPEQYAKMKARL